MRNKLVCNKRLACVYKFRSMRCSRELIDSGLCHKIYQAVRREMVSHQMDLIGDAEQRLARPRIISRRVHLARSNEFNSMRKGRHGTSSAARRYVTSICLRQGAIDPETEVLLRRHVRREGRRTGLPQRGGSKRAIIPDTASRVVTRVRSSTVACC
jgi:hypothetical protein